jgi:hypothetical protein
MHSQTLRSTWYYKPIPPITLHDIDILYSNLIFYLQKNKEERHLLNTIHYVHFVTCHNFASAIFMLHQMQSSFIVPKCDAVTLLEMCSHMILQILYLCMNLKRCHVGKRISSKNVAQFYWDFVIEINVYFQKLFFYQIYVATCLRSSGQDSNAVLYFLRFYAHECHTIFFAKCCDWQEVGNMVDTNLHCKLSKGLLWLIYL